MKERKDKQPIWLENRPNRNVKSLDQSSEDGFEIGDGGKFASELEKEIEVDIFINSLTKTQQRVVRMLYEGYKQVEIARELGITPPAVNKIIKSVKGKLPF